MSRSIKKCPMCGTSHAGHRQKCECGHFFYANRTFTMQAKRANAGKFRLEWTRPGWKFYTNNGDGIMFFMYHERHTYFSHPRKIAEITTSSFVSRHGLRRWGYTVNGLNGAVGFHTFGLAQQHYFDSIRNDNIDEDIIQAMIIEHGY